MKESLNKCAMIFALHGKMNKLLSMKFPFPYFIVLFVKRLDKVTLCNNNRNY